jgi:hypothetical protein
VTGIPVTGAFATSVQMPETATSDGATATPPIVAARKVVTLSNFLIRGTQSVRPGSFKAQRRRHDGHAAR